MDIDPRHLAHLLGIHEQGSLSHAAQVLHLSQPALSSSIAVLDQRLRRGRLGPLAIGVTPSLVEQFMHSVLKLLLAELPDLSISVIEGLDGPLNEALLRGELGLVIGAVGQPHDTSAIVEDFMLADPFLLVVHDQSSLAGGHPSIWTRRWINSGSFRVRAGRRMPIRRRCSSTPGPTGHRGRCSPIR